MDNLLDIIYRRFPMAIGETHGDDYLRDHAGNRIPIKKQFSSAPKNFRDPAGQVMKLTASEMEAYMGAEHLGQGYKTNEVFWITVIEDPPITMDPADQQKPRMVIAPKAYLAPSVEIAFLMAGKDVPADADLQRCRIRVANG